MYAEPVSWTSNQTPLWDTRDNWEKKEKGKNWKKYIHKYNKNMNFALFSFFFSISPTHLLKNGKIESSMAEYGSFYYIALNSVQFSSFSSIMHISVICHTPVREVWEGHGSLSLITLHSLFPALNILHQGEPLPHPAPGNGLLSSKRRNSPLDSVQILYLFKGLCTHNFYDDNNTGKSLARKGNSEILSC